MLPVRLSLLIGLKRIGIVALSDRPAVAGEIVGPDPIVVVLEAVGKPLVFIEHFAQKRVLQDHALVVVFPPVHQYGKLFVTEPLFAARSVTMLQLDESPQFDGQGNDAEKLLLAVGPIDHGRGNGHDPLRGCLRREYGREMRVIESIARVGPPLPVLPVPQSTVVVGPPGVVFPQRFRLGKPYHGDSPFVAEETARDFASLDTLRKQSGKLLLEVAGLVARTELAAKLLLLRHGLFRLVDLSGQRLQLGVCLDIGQQPTEFLGSGHLPGQILDGLIATLQLVAGGSGNELRGETIALQCPIRQRRVRFINGRAETLPGKPGHDRQQQGRTNRAEHHQRSTGAAGRSLVQRINHRLDVGEPLTRIGCQATIDDLAQLAIRTPNMAMGRRNRRLLD